MSAERIPLALVELVPGDSAALVLEPQECYDDAIVGYAPDQDRVVYSIPAVIEALMAYNEWDEETAAEYAFFNTMGATVPGSPIFIYPGQPQ